MPFDATWLMSRDDDARTQWIKAAKRIAAGYYCAVEALPKEAPPGARKLMSHSVHMLNVLEVAFDNGRGWVQQYARKDFRYCLTGALHTFRNRRYQEPDHTGIYLSRAIRQLCGKRMKIVDFNDSRANFADIQAAIVLAKQLAQEVVDSAQLDVSGDARNAAG